MKALLKLLQRHKAGSGEGIYSVCSSHPLVIEAALREAHRREQWTLLEATSNQVNQFGGYSGMTPAQCVASDRRARARRCRRSACCLGVITSDPMPGVPRPRRSPWSTRSG